GRWGAAAGEVERLRTGLLEQRVGLAGLHADDQVLSVHTNGHVATEEEGDAAEHLFLDDPRSASELPSDACGLHLRVRHRSREALSAHETWRRLPQVNSRLRASSGRTRRLSTDES